MDPTGILHHPAVESVAIPLVLSCLLAGLLRSTAGPSRAGMAVGIALLASVAWMAGLSTRPTSVLQKLPWVFAVAWIAGVVLDRVGAGLLRWLVLTACWAAAAWWLETASIERTIAFAVAGAIVIGLQLRSAPDRADGPVTAILASLGLAATALQAGSLALFQVSLMLAAVLGGVALWLWPRSRILYGTSAAAVASLGWLALAQATANLVPAAPGALVLLGLAFVAAVVAAPLIGRMAVRSRGFAAPLLVALLAAGSVAGGLALQTGAAATGTAEDGTAGGDDAYYPGSSR